MRIFLCCSKHVYDRIPPIKEELERRGHAVTLPNSYDAPMKEEEMKLMSPETHSEWKAKMIRLQAVKIAGNDAILVLNLEKNGQPNYIGGATFLEMFKAFETGKKIFLYNPVPDTFLRDEILGMGPIVIDGNLDLIQ